MTSELNFILKYRIEDEYHDKDDDAFRSMCKINIMRTTVYVYIFKSYQRLKYTCLAKLIIIRFYMYIIQLHFFSDCDTLSFGSIVMSTSKCIDAPYLYSRFGLSSRLQGL